MLGVALGFERVPAYFSGKSGIGSAIKVSSLLIDHVASQFFGKPTDLFLAADFFDKHTLRSFYLITDRRAAWDFRDFSDDYVEIFLPALIANKSSFPLVPEVLRVPAAETPGFGLVMRLPLLDAPHRCLEAWYVHPHKWSLDKGCAKTYATDAQARNILACKEPSPATQLTFPMSLK